MMFVKCNFVFRSHGVAFYMLMKHNGLLMMFAKIMGIYECSLPRCFCRSCVRDLLIWKMCSFTELFLTSQNLTQFCNWRVMTVDKLKKKMFSPILCWFLLRRQMLIIFHCHWKNKRMSLLLKEITNISA